MSSTRLSLAQQIAQLEDTAPIDFDPEDVQITGIVSDDDDTVKDSGARAHYLDVGPSALRKLHDSIADPKYDGKRTTRQQLMESDEGNSELESDDNLSDEEASGSHPSINEDEDEDLPSQSNPEEDGSEVDEAGDISRPSPPKDSEAPEDLSSALRKTREEDHKKGKAVSRQIAIWDSLLDARIRLQKSTTAANRLPAPSDFSRFDASPEGREFLDKMLEEAMSLSEEIFELQESLLISNESIHPPPRKRRRTQDGEADTSADYTAQIRSASQAASALEQSIHPHLVQTLSKWSSKIQAVAPSVLLPSNRGAFSGKSAQGLKSAVQLVDETLRGADYDKLLARTRVHRGKGVRVGKNVVADGADEEPEDADVDVEIFDDTDFYQQLLRDVIDSRANGSGVGGADDWMVIQKQKKAKKKVDTKASKGRKLRYEVHEKLQNFMVPVPVQGSWHDEQIDELFASLLGKGFESAGGIYGPDVSPDADIEAAKRLELELGEALKGGFRVFG